MKRPVNMGNPLPFIVALVLEVAAGPTLEVCAQAEDQTSAAPPAGSVLILDASAYWQHYFVVGPAKVSAAKLKSEGEKYMKAAYLDRLKGSVARMLKGKGRDSETWYDAVTYASYVTPQEMLNDVRPTPPPETWQTPAYEARDWSRIKRPYLMYAAPKGDAVMGGTCLNIPRACFRTWFEVSDPAGVRDLQLALTFRGGIRIFVNGEEAGRSHLPAGELDPLAPAESYPAEAYYLMPDEVPPGTKAGSRSGYLADDSFIIAKETLGRFAGKPGEFRGMEGDYHYGLSCNEKGFNRLAALRNRTAVFSIPARLLKKGPNLLAVDLRSSELHPLALAWGGQGTANWPHARILELRLTAAAPVGPSNFARPPGVQVWAEDIHTRVFSRDFYPGPRLPTNLKISGAPGGTHGAQIVVGTDKELKNLRAEIGALQGESGRTLPAPAFTVLYAQPHPFWDIRALGEGKGEVFSSQPGPAASAPAILRRYYSEEAISKAGRNAEPLLKELQFFDHLAARPPERVPADSAQALWLSLRIPGDARAGVYRGKVQVKAEGMESAALDLTVEVANWRLPDPRDFITIMAVEQSPHAVARQYKTPLWSDAHFAKMDDTFKLMARMGGDFLGIPVLVNTEFGNRDDSPIRITRRKSGELSLDFSIVDRYVDLAARHMGMPQCICFLVGHAGPTDEKQTIKVFDEASGKSELVCIDQELPEEQRREHWRALASGIDRHMQARGLQRQTYWGLIWDQVNDDSLPLLLKEFAPAITWVRYSHMYRPDATYTWCATVRGAGLELQWPTLKGWKSPAVNLSISRDCNGVWTAYGTSCPFAARVGTERALCAGGRGIGRLGADYWLSTWLSGFKVPTQLTGMPYLALFWPGPDGAETSIRYEAMLEGLQEAEARIFLEQAAEKTGDEALAQRITGVLNRHLATSLLMPTGTPNPALEEVASGWQDRSQELFALAGEVAQRIGVDFDRNVVDCPAAALGKTAVVLKLRNWTSAPRDWTLAADKDWIKFARASGQALPGQQPFEITLDTTGLTPGQSAEGKLTLTDKTAGRVESVNVKARVSAICSFSTPDSVANIGTGKTGSIGYTLMNHSAANLDWSLACFLPWAKPEPAAGKLGPLEQAAIRIVITPPGTERARREFGLKLTPSAGVPIEEKIAVHSIPPYAAPAALPPGKALAFQDLPKERFKPAKDSRGREYQPIQFWNPENPRAGQYNGWPSRAGRVLSIGSKTEKAAKGQLVAKPDATYEKAFGCQPGFAATVLLEGSGATAFSAEVGWLFGSNSGPTRPEMHFEVYVDGVFRGHSDLMDVKDAPRLLVVEGLKGAKEMTFTTRLSTDRTDAPASSSGQFGTSHSIALFGVWGNPTLYTASDGEKASPSEQKK